MTGSPRTVFDVVIVGAGPAGCTAAIQLARAGWSVALIERQRFPRRKVCGECIAASNLPLLDAFMECHSSRFDWVRPSASPIGFPRFKAGDATAFCEAVVRDISVLLLPGAVYDEPQHLRISFGRANMPEALERLERYLAKLPS